LENRSLVAALNFMRSSVQPAPLTSSAIVDAMASEWRQECTVEAVAATVSTNEDLVARARVQQPARNLLRAADFQSAGRGRKRRAWHAAPGGALLFSVAIPLTATSHALPPVTLACGVALAESLLGHGISVKLKWPNDIQVGGRKLGGILAELVADRSGSQTLVVGVGINLQLNDDVRSKINRPAIALDELGHAAQPTREQWIGEFGSAIFAASAQFLIAGFEPFRARFNRLLDSRGEVVDVLHDAVGALPLSGRVIEVDNDGRLVIEDKGQRHAISVGDVSVRR
jgi:BirA family biotin operon repressor/biotin-[acetyl-CoA-carboxylase] ligase